MRAYFSSDRRLRCRAVNTQWLELQSVYTSWFFIHQLKLKRKAQALLWTRGPKSQKLFWGYVSGARKKHLGIDVLEDNGVSSSDPHHCALHHQEV